MAEKTDLRVVKTHKTIREALIALLDEQDYTQISVQDIIDRAMVNRSTFYKYYSGKGDLAWKMLNDFKADYSAALEKRFADENPRTMLQQAVPVFFEQRHLLLALWKIRSGRLHLYDDMHQILYEAYADHPRNAGHRGNVDYQATIFATIALATAKYYLERDQPVPMDSTAGELSSVIARLKV